LLLIIYFVTATYICGMEGGVGAHFVLFVVLERVRDIIILVVKL